MFPLPPRGATIVPIFRAELFAPKPSPAPRFEDDRRFETPLDERFGDLVALRYVYFAADGAYRAVSCENALAPMERAVWLRADTRRRVDDAPAAVVPEARRSLALRADLRAAIERARGPSETFAAHAAAMRAILARRGTAGFVEPDDAPSARPLLAVEAEPEGGWGALEAAARYIDDAVHLFVCAVLVGMHAARLPGALSVRALLDCLGRAVVASAGTAALAAAVPRLLRAHAHRLPWVGAMLDSVGMRCTLGGLVALGARLGGGVVGSWVAAATVDPMHECAAWLAGAAPWTRGVVAIALALADIWRAARETRDPGALRELATLAGLRQTAVDAHIDAVLAALFPAERAAEYRRLVPRRILRTALGVALGAADVADAVRRMHKDTAALMLACVGEQRAG
jgi:hypothetical protein